MTEVFVSVHRYGRDMLLYVGVMCFGIMRIFYFIMFIF